MKTYTGIITELPENGIFVFGSNTQGRHGKGAAKVALEKFGAVYGDPEGLQGRSYAIITKDLTKKDHPSVSKWNICAQINALYFRADLTPEKDFYIAYSGAGGNLNGYTAKEMAEMFFQAGQDYGLIPDNIVFEEKFSKLIQS